MKLNSIKSLIISLFILSGLITSCENEREEDQIILLQKHFTNSHDDALPLDNGLFYVLIDTAQGEDLISPEPGDSLFISITGTLADNKTALFSADYLDPLIHIYKEYPAIEGWELSMAQMHQGDSVVIGLPPSLAYGDKREGLIPPYSSLIFKMRLIKIVKN